MPPKKGRAAAKKGPAATKVTKVTTPRRESTAESEKRPSPPNVSQTTIVTAEEPQAVCEPPPPSISSLPLEDRLAAATRQLSGKTVVVSGWHWIQSKDFHYLVEDFGGTVVKSGAADVVIHGDGWKRGVPLSASAAKAVRCGATLWTGQDLAAAVTAKYEVPRPDDSDEEIPMDNFSSYCHDAKPGWKGVDCAAVTPLQKRVELANGRWTIFRPNGYGSGPAESRAEFENTVLSVVQQDLWEIQEREKEERAQEQ